MHTPICGLSWIYECVMCITLGMTYRLGHWMFGTLCRLTRNGFTSAAWSARAIWTKYATFMAAEWQLWCPCFSGQKCVSGGRHMIGMTISRIMERGNLCTRWMMSPPKLRYSRRNRPRCVYIPGWKCASNSGLCVAPRGNRDLWLCCFIVLEGATAALRPLVPGSS